MKMRSIFMLMVLFCWINETYSQSDLFNCRINVGGDKWVDTRGQEWLGDHIYQTGYGYLGISSVYTTKEIVGATEIQPIYQSERFKLFGYRVDVPNGHYQIILHFAEVFHHAKGKRLFDIKIENKLVVENLDIYERVGKNTALKLVFNTKDLGIPISDNRLDIEFEKKRDDVKLSGIEVMQMADKPTLLKIEPLKLDFELQDELALTLMNVGGSDVEWSFKQEKYPKWLWQPMPANGIIRAEDITEIKIRALRNGIGSGIQKDTLVIVAPDFKQKIPVSMIIAGEANLIVATPEIDFKDCYRYLPGIIKNEGGSSLSWFIDVGQLPSWVQRVYPASGNLEIGETAFFNITINRKGVAIGTHQGILPIKTKTANHRLSLQVTIPDEQNRHLFVHGNAQGLRNGNSWEHAFISIKDAIASIGQLGPKEIVELWIAEGTYYEHNIKVPTGIHLYGGFKGDENYRAERESSWYHPTIVDGMKQDRCFECFHRTVIDGFVIQNGRDWSAGDGKGAAILTYDADVVIRNNLIRDHVDSWAGALFIDGFDRRSKVPGSSPLVEHNVFINNFAIYCAAAIEIRASAAIIRNNTIVDNKGFGLEIQDLLGPFSQITYGKLYNNIVTENIRKKENDIWAEARKATNYSFIGNKWSVNDKGRTYDHGIGNIFGDVSQLTPKFVDRDNEDFHLQSDSPCIDAGDPRSDPDADGTRSDIGAFPYNKNQIEFVLSQQLLDFGSDKQLLTLKIKAYGGKAAAWRIAEYFPDGFIFSVSPKSGILKNGEEALLNINVNRISMDDATFEGFLAVMSPTNSQEIKIKVQINNNRPKIALDPTYIEVDGMINDSKPITRAVNIYNAGYGNLNWKVQKKFAKDWLQVSPSFGMDKHTITLTFKPEKLGFGEYREEVVISCAEAINQCVNIPVLFRIKPKKFVYEIEAEKSVSLPKIGWKATQNEGASCIQAVMNSLDAPDDTTRLDYEFTVPEGVEGVYVFAEIDVNGSRSMDSFWVMVNGYDPCLWDFINSKEDSWSRAWVYHKKRDAQHLFVAIPGKNKLNLFPRETGAFVNWFVITNDPGLNIHTYKFGSSQRAGTTFLGE